MGPSVVSTGTNFQDRHLFLNQMTFKSLFEDKDDTPGKYDLERSAEPAPILSHAVDALITSPYTAYKDQSNKLRLHISDFELKHLEKRVTGDLFSSTKKKKASGCQFDQVTLDTCSTSSETSQGLPVVSIYDAVFGEQDSIDSDLSLTTSRATSMETYVSSPQLTDRERSLSGADSIQSTINTPRLRFAAFLDQKVLDKALEPCVQSLKQQMKEADSAKQAQTNPVRMLKGMKLKAEGTFSLF